MKHIYRWKIYDYTRGFFMKSKARIHPWVVLNVIIVSMLLLVVTTTAEQFNVNVSSLKNQRNDFANFSIITPSGCVADVQRYNNINLFFSNNMKSHQQELLVSHVVQPESSMMDGSDWSNAGGNANRNGLSETKGPLTADLLWSGGRTSIISWLPVTEDNRLFVIRQAGWPGSAHDSPVIAMDLSTGEELWSIEIPYHTNDWTTWVTGVNTDHVYASRSGNGASVLDNLYALDAETGETLWVSTVLIDAGPYDGVVFTADGDPVIASFTDIWRFNSEDGSLVWHANRVGSVSGSCGGALFQNGFYVADAAPGGHVIVRYDVDTGQRLYESSVMPGFTLQNTPFVGPDGTIYLSRTQNNPTVDYFYAFTDTGTSLTEKWHQACAWTTFSEFAASFDGSVYCVLPGPRIGKLNSNNGSIMMQTDLIGEPDTYLSPHFAVDAFGTVYFSNGGFADGRVSVYSSDLTPLWNITMTNINIGGPSLGQNGILVLCGTGANIRAYQPAQPTLDINITNVFPRICATITNNGEAAATNLSWSISVTGGLLGRINSKEFGRTNVLESMEHINVSNARMIFGFGKIILTVSATCDEGVDATEKVDGFLFLFFIVRNT
jgi:hypothetical protein